MHDEQDRKVQKRKRQDMARKNRKAWNRTGQKWTGKEKVTRLDNICRRIG